MAGKGTAFTISSAGDRGGAGPKPKPGRKGPFKFLRKDEGLRAGEVNAQLDGTTGSDDAGTPRRTASLLQKEREFRQAVAADKQRRESDPFAEALVAVPKKPPPKPEQAQPEPSATSRRMSPPNNAHRVNTAELDDGDFSFEPPTLAVTRKPAAKQQPPQRQPQQQQQQRTLQTQQRRGDSRSGSAQSDQFDAEAVASHGEEEDAYDDTQDYAITAGTSAPNTARGSRPALQFERPPPPSAKRDDAKPRQRSRYEMLRDAMEERSEQQAPVTASHRVQDRDDSERVNRRAVQPLPAASARGPRSFSQPVPTRRVAELARVEEAEADDDAYDNYFEEPPTRRVAHPARTAAGNAAAPAPRGRPAPAAATTATAGDDEELMAELERQIEEVRAEKAKYQRLVSEFQRKRERDQKESSDAVAELQADRDDFEQWVAEEKKAIRKERKQLEDQRKRQTDAAGTEKEANRRLQAEVENARDALDKMSVELREKDRTHRAESERMKRQIADLQARNDELTEMLRTYQSSEAERTSVERITRVGSNHQQPPPRNETHVGRAAPSKVPPRNAGARRRSPSTEPEYEEEGAGTETAASEDRDLGPPPSSTRRPAAAAEADPRGVNRSADIRRDAAVVRSPQNEKSRRPQYTDPAITRTDSRTSSDIAVKQQHGVPASQSGQRRAGSFVVPTAEEFIAEVAEPVPNEDAPGDSVTARNVGTDGKSEQLYRSGKRVINYANGTRKVVLQTGHVILHFSNGDVKRTFPSGKTTYWYAVAQTTHTQMPTGMQVFQFHSSQQTEKHYPDGRKEILYPEGVYKMIAIDGSETIYFPDGSFSSNPAPRN
jgi:hypothetical protein